MFAQGNLGRSLRDTVTSGFECLKVPQAMPKIQPLSPSLLCSLEPHFVFRPIVLTANPGFECGRCLRCVCLCACVCVCVCFTSDRETTGEVGTAQSALMRVCPPPLKVRSASPMVTAGRLSHHLSLALSCSLSLSLSPLPTPLSPAAVSESCA